MISRELVLKIPFPDAMAAAGKMGKLRNVHKVQPFKLSNLKASESAEKTVHPSSIMNLLLQIYLYGSVILTLNAAFNLLHLTSTEICG